MSTEWCDRGREILDSLSAEDRDAVASYLSEEQEVLAMLGYEEQREWFRQAERQDAEVAALRQQLSHEDVVDALRRRVRDRGLDPADPK